VARDVANVAPSVHQRLLNKARESGRSVNRILSRLVGNRQVRKHFPDALAGVA